MADILRVSFPTADKGYINPNKTAPEVTSPFNIVDIARVTKPQTDSALLQQNNTALENSNAPAILEEMLKDPKVTVTFLRNIFLLEEIFRLLPTNNSVITDELQKLFDSLMLKPEKLLGELLRQSASSSQFQGDVFTLLRNLEQGGDNRMRDAVAQLLKAFSGEQGKQEVMRSISNNLFFLGASQQPLKSLSDQFLRLADAFKAPGANFEMLKGEVMQLLKQQEGSLLNSPALQKLSAMLVYNLSRYQSNDDFLSQAVTKLAVLMDREGGQLLTELKSLVNGIQNPELRTTLSELLNRSSPDFATFVKTLVDNMQAVKNPHSSSQVMDALTEIITKEGRLSDLQLVSDNRINEIITSLLSSPCNYTPLIHLVFPLEFLDIRSFAEMWIDNNTEGGEGDGGDDTQHLLIAFDIEGIGAFETEIFTKGKELRLLLLCPEQHTEAFKSLRHILPGIISKSGYRLIDCNVDDLVRGRSLMEVFSELPNRRKGLDMKA